MPGGPDRRPSPAPLATASEGITLEDLLSVESRRIVFECVGTHPGAHLRDVARRCGLPLGTTLYHLDTLQAATLVTTRRDGRYKRYFTATAMGRREKDVLSALRHETPRRLVEELLASPPLTQRELCERLGLSRSTLSFHASSLVAQGILQRLDERPERRYVVAERELATSLLERFGASLRVEVKTPPAPAPAPEPSPGEVLA